jgi:hypothetical protein
MKIRAGRIVIAALATEVVAILALFAIVALFGPNETTAAQQFAERIGFWFGPASGFVLCIGAAFWVTKGLTSGHVYQGVLLGIAAAAIDIILLVASGASFQPVFAISNAGRVGAGAIGGWLASRGRPGAT